MPPGSELRSLHIQTGNEGRAPCPLSGGCAAWTLGGDIEPRSEGGARCQMPAAGAKRPERQGCSKAAAEEVQRSWSTVDLADVDVEAAEDDDRVGDGEADGEVFEDAEVDVGGRANMKPVRRR